MVYPKSSLLEIFYPDHKILRSANLANLSVDNRLHSTSQKRAEYILKMSWRRVNNNSLTLWYVLKTCWICLKEIFPRRLKDVLKTLCQDALEMSWRRLQEVFKTFSRRFEDALKTFLQDVLKTSWRRLENVLKTFWKHLEGVSPKPVHSLWLKLLEDVLKTSSEDVWLSLIYSSWSRHLLNLKT